MPKTTAHLTIPPPKKSYPSILSPDGIPTFAQLSAITDEQKDAMTLDEFTYYLSRMRDYLASTGIDMDAISYDDDGNEE